MSKTCIVSGITGQDGAYLSRLLINKGYSVIGLIRSNSAAGLKGLDYLQVRDQVSLIECDMLDITQLLSIIKQYEPCCVYNLAAQSSVSLSFNQPIGTFKFNTISVYNLLEAIRIVDPTIKFYQASSSEMFGNVNNLPITERSVLHPKSPYAISKAAGHFACINYRESYGLPVFCGILFNHESYLRNENFFIKKVIKQSLEIKKGTLETLSVGNIDIKRDFGYAPLYVEAMYEMTQKETGDDFIICSSHSTSLRTIIEYVFEKLGINMSRLVIDKDLYRPAEICDIYGDGSKAARLLNWEYKWSIYDMLDKLIEEEIQNMPALNSIQNAQPTNNIYEYYNYKIS
jgi:GDPmannose 4,6-dehydratase